MSVSRDFIDSYSPEAFPPRADSGEERFAALTNDEIWQHNVSFRFPAGGSFSGWHQGSVEEWRWYLVVAARG
jgi:hypothetical protein